MRSAQRLDGLWDFDFAGDGSDDCRLEVRGARMSVPGCFDTVEPFRLERGIGTYRRQLACSGRVRLSIGGLGLRAELRWDGRDIGRIDTPFMATELVFDAGSAGSHTLEIAVDNRIDAASSSQFHPFYDFYGYGGIYRSVELDELDDFWIERLTATPLSLESGTLEAALELGGNFPASGAAAEFELDGRPAGQFDLAGINGKFTLKLDTFTPWTPEHPELHTLTVRVGAETKSVRFGMRTVTARAGRILLNGEPVKLIGYCRHDSHPEFGYAMPRQLVFSDLAMIKAQGANFIRGSHYPQSEEMLDICDELGLLVWDESLGWGNLVDSLTDPVFQARQVEQTRAMARRSANHPSVIIWGFLNEAHTEDSVARELVGALCRALREVDASRLITFASCCCCRQKLDTCLDLVDVVALNFYPGWYDNADPVRRGLEKFNRKEFLRGVESASAEARSPKFLDKPLIISEVGAAAIPGDHSGQRWSEEYQAELDATVVEYVLGDHRPSGVALWMFCDTKTYSDANALSRPRGFNNKGLLDEFRRPKAAWRAVGALLAARK